MGSDSMILLFQIPLQMVVLIPTKTDGSIPGINIMCMCMYSMKTKV